MRSDLFLMAIAMFLYLLFPQSAQAYIDLGLGGQIFQTFYIIGISALLFVVSPFLFFWKNIVRLVRRLWRRKEGAK